MAEVAEKLVSARALKYSEILELDQKIHEFDPEKFVSSSIDDSAKNGGSSQSGLPKFLWVLLKDACEPRMYVNKIALMWTVAFFSAAPAAPEFLYTCSGRESHESDAMSIRTIVLVDISECNNDIACLA